MRAFAAMGGSDDKHRDEFDDGASVTKFNSDSLTETANGTAASVETLEPTAINGPRGYYERRVTDDVESGHGISPAFGHPYAQ